MSKLKGEFLNPSSWESSTVFFMSANATMLACAVAFMIALQVVAPEQYLRNLGPILSVLLVVTVCLLFISGRKRLAKSVLAVGSWLIIGILSLISGGVRAPIAIAYPLSIIFSGLLMGWRFGLALSGMTVAVIAGFVVAESLGELPEPPASPSVLFGVTEIILVLGSSALVFFFVRLYKVRLLELLSISESLSQRTRDLEEVEARYGIKWSSTLAGGFIVDPETAKLSFDELFSLLSGHEQNWHENHRLTQLLREAKLKSSQACVDDIRYGGGRKLDKSLMVQLSTCLWIRLHRNLLITGATGCGKTWLACAFGNAACRQGLSVLYVRTPRLFEELRSAHADGSFSKRLAVLAKADLLILDDWGSAPLNQVERNDFLEVIDDRVGTRATLITSQLPPEHWRAYLNDPKLADAILDRLLPNAYRVALAGASLRKQEHIYA